MPRTVTKALKRVIKVKRETLQGVVLTADDRSFDLRDIPLGATNCDACEQKFENESRVMTRMLPAEGLVHTALRHSPSFEFTTHRQVFET